MFCKSLLFSSSRRSGSFRHLFLLFNFTFRCTAVFSSRRCNNLFLITVQEVAGLLEEGIRTGVVQPLSYTIFSSEKAEDAFRFMSAGKHIGKV